MAEQSQSRREQIVVIGGGGHAKVIIAILRKSNAYDVIGYTDHKDHGAVLGIPFLGSDRELNSRASETKQLAAVLGVGQVGLGEARRKIWNTLRSEVPFLRFPRIVTPDAIVNEEVAIADGAVIFDGAVVSSGAHIGCGAIVNTHSTLEHDVILGDWVHVAPGATISGGANIGQFSMIGAGATVIEGISIAAACMIGAGAVVVNDLKESGVYVGCPARRIK
jgi:UDP-perosamine 4-acetyltransferase